MHFEFAGRDRCDLALEDARALIGDLQPKGVINASGYTSVDGAETDRVLADRLNVGAVREMARACADREIPLVHVSTDYVFDGHKGAAYTEADPAHPLNHYGRTKLAGEDTVFSSGAKAAVIRTSWIFGSGATNFLGQMLRKLDGSDQVRIVSDQRARPTWSGDVAAAVVAVLLRLVENDPAASGLFHLAGADDATRVQMAKFVFEWAKSRGHKVPSIIPVPTRAYSAAAKRPLDTRLDSTKITLLGIEPRPWRERLAQCLAELDG